MPSLLLNFVAFIHLLGAPGAVADEAQVSEAVQVAQAQISQAQEASNRAANVLAAAQKKQKSFEAQKAKLRTTYNGQLAEVDKLKRARASWRRDRQLRDQKARSQKTALALKDVDRKLRSQRAAVSKARKALAVAIDKELDTSPTAARQTYLKSMLGKVRVSLRKAPKKISMPELELDEFADPEELLEQIALIERAEKKLAREQASLTRRAEHYAHMESLRSKRQRADALGVFDEDGVRRSTGHVANKNDRNSGNSGPTSGGAGADLSDSESAEPSPPGGDDFDSSGSFEAASVVLADVVDSGTQDALRRAHRSNSPKTKAAAAKRAKEQVSDRLLRLRASKAKIRRHLKRLQKR